MAKKARKVRIRRRRSLRERLRTVPLPVKGGLVLAVLGALAAAGALAARRHVLGAAELTFRVEEIRVDGVPEWLDPVVRESLLRPREGILPERVHVLDREPLARLAAYYEAHEWVARLHRLEYVIPGPASPGGIVGSLSLKELLCAVYSPSDRAYHLVDLEGNAMRGALERPPPAELRLPVIYGGGDVAPPAPGDVWRADSVLHGFFIAALLHEEGLRFEYPHWIAEIDVGHTERWDRSQIALRTEDRVVLQWGRSPRSGRSGRTPFAETAEKVLRLRTILAGRGRGYHGAEINLFEPLQGWPGETEWLSARRPSRS
jgi:hypothetical protein